jgi:glycine betaine catabolism B
MMKLTLKDRSPETHDTENFFWEPEAPLDFKSGQFLRWNLPHENPDDRGTSRFFSIASSPTEELIRLTTKFNPQGSSFKKALQKINVGDAIEASGPMGSFTLDTDSTDELVLVAGGIGVTPYRSMLKYMHDTGKFIPVHLIYACRSPQDVAFAELFGELRQEHQDFKITYVFESEGDFKESYRTGRLSAEMIQDICGNDDSQKVYLSGPEPMIKSLKEQLLASGHSEELIKTDYFPGYSII